MLTIEPETTQDSTPEKTPEQMQQEAVENGGMTTRHWFNWCYPWYRTYIVFCTGVSPLNQWEMGFNPLLPDEGSASGIDEIWDFFVGIIEEFGYDFAMGLLKIAGARILTYLGERPFLTLPNVQAIIFGIGCATSLFLLYTDWNNKAALYGGALGAFLVMAITGAPKFGPVFIGLLSYIIGKPCFETIGKILWAIQEIVTNMIKALFRSLIDVAEVLFGAALIIAALWRASTLSHQ